MAVLALDMETDMILQIKAANVKFRDPISTVLKARLKK